jgi:formylglycine-generating enzyme required for sulfatase activity
MLEWVHDQYMKKERRRVRGASYVDTANALRAGNRGAFQPDRQHVNLGFRVVRDLPS